MKVWITCFIVLFGTAELLQWVRQFSLPLPVFILGGVFLAIASNYDKLSNLPFHPDDETPEPSQAEVSPAQMPRPIQVPPPKKQPIQPISFEIRKPFQPGD
ncbi:hypothetical protein J5X98_23005 [Leptothermofonsia sichuanensis E412]|uniref:hypothetical protein n=1 Tax=Leptothermofonsia sichuanensis TaxID=2917832 RepID=UPI001CA72C0D|nr:hypothetical protein [Leptothermofonsia sichuanensis]QZZ20115.1 hypothetical protein J5X98_23005 [Leptothermofonsia sichuanensis E412]